MNNGQFHFVLIFWDFIHWCCCFVGTRRCFLLWMQPRVVFTDCPIFAGFPGLYITGSSQMIHNHFFKKQSFMEFQASEKYRNVVCMCGWLDITPGNVWNPFCKNFVLWATKSLLQWEVGESPMHPIGSPYE